MENNNYDTSVIRPQIRAGDIRHRGSTLSRRRRRAVKKALRTLHTLELMAVNIYKFQITNDPTEHNRLLIAAMCNEMTHYQDFQTKLYEYGLRPGKFRWAYWLLGLALGFTSRLLGKKAILKTGIWVETKAVTHYARLLRTVEWHEDTRKIIEKNQADEGSHIRCWKKLLYPDRTPETSPQT